jgi:hypothetical protein
MPPTYKNFARHDQAPSVQPAPQDFLILKTKKLESEKAKEQKINQNTRG